MPQHSNHRSPRRRRQKERPWENTWGDNSWKRKEMFTHIQETQRVPNRINPRWNTPRHILIKLTKIKHKEQILKAAREKQQITHKGIPMRITADLSIETLHARREWQNKLTAQITTPSKDLIQTWRRNQSFTDKQKLQEFSTTKSALQQKLKDLL